MKSRNIGVVLSYARTALNMFCGFFLSSFFVKMLGDTEYGLYQMVTSFVSYLVLLEFGTGTAMTRNICKCRAQNASDEEIRKNVSTVWGISLILAMIIVFASVIFYAETGNIYRNLSSEQVSYAQKILFFQVVYMLISFLSTTLNGIILGFEEYKLGPILAIVKLLSRTVLLIFIIAFYRYAIAIAIVDAFISLFIVIYLFIFCKRHFIVSFNPKDFDRNVFIETLPLCTAMFIQTLVNQANSSVDQFVIGIKLTPEQVSYYSIGLFFYNAFSSLTTTPISMYGPQIVKDVTQNVEKSVLMEHLIAPSRLITLIGSTVLCGFFVAGRQFINIFYGANYKISWYVGLIIMFPMMINMSNGVLINILDALNKRMSRSYVLMVTTLANIILTVIWIDRWGVIGACAATAVCTLAGQITLMNIYYSKKLQIPVLHMYYRTFKGIIIPQLISIIPSFIIGRLILNDIISLILSAFSYLLIFSLLYIKYGMQDNEKVVLKSFPIIKWRINS